MPSPRLRRATLARFCLALLFVLLAPAAGAQNAATGVLLVLSAQAAGTVTSGDRTNAAWRGAIVTVNLTTMTTATLVVHIQGKDVGSGKYYDILASQSLTAATVSAPVALTVYPGVLSTGASYPSPLPGVWRITAVVTGGSAAVTGQIDVTMIP
jgi:hypothetical protein